MATAGLLRLSGRANAATRHAVWWIALACVAVLPLLAVQRLAPIPRSDPHDGVGQTRADSAPMVPGLGDIAATDRVRGVTTVALAPTTVRLTVLGWLATAASLLIRLLRRLVGLRAVVRNTQPLAASRCRRPVRRTAVSVERRGS